LVDEVPGCLRLVLGHYDTTTVHVSVEARKDDGFDPVWLRNAVTEPVEESGAEVDP
jgi:hypothetical protein